MERVGLVLEGGALRGLFTAGVLDYFTDAGIQFEYVIGVSAGACNAISYISGQRGRNYYINLTYAGDRRYISMGNYLRSGSMVGEKFVYDDIPYRLAPFAFEAYRQSPARLIATCTDLTTGRPFYQRIDDCAAQVDYIRASASLPFISRPVEIDGHVLLDGGVSDSIPLAKSISDGNVRNVVVLTRPAGYRKTASKSAGAYPFYYYQYPQFVQTMKNRPFLYNNCLQFVEEQEKEGKAVVLRPDGTIHVGRFEHKREKLRALYLSGYNTARESYPAIAAICAGAANVQLDPAAVAT